MARKAGCVCHPLLHRPDVPILVTHALRQHLAYKAAYACTLLGRLNSGPFKCLVFNGNGQVLHVSSLHEFRATRNSCKLNPAITCSTDANWTGSAELNASNSERRS